VKEEARPLLEGKKVLVTGARGFIGRGLLAALMAHEANVAALDMVPPDTKGSVGLATYTGDIGDRAFVDDCVGRCKPDVVFHLAAFKERSSDVDDFYKALSVNVLGSLNLLSSLVRQGGVSSVVVLGTAEEYGKNESPFTESMREAPVTVYSYSKLCVTNLCSMFHSLYRLPVVVLRPTLAYGPGQEADMFLPSLIRSLMEGRPFVMTPGEQTRDFVYITDLVEAMIRASRAEGAAGQVINIGSGTPVKLLELVAMVEKHMDRQGLVRVGGREYRTDEIMDYFVDTSKARRLIGWQSKTSLDEGVKLTIASFMPREGK
jgi:nucleoside-diphosphate-sugar epimerase